MSEYTVKQDGETVAKVSTEPFEIHEGKDNLPDVIVNLAESESVDYTLPEDEGSSATETRRKANPQEVTNRFRALTNSYGFTLQTDAVGEASDNV
jgi:hypothetical protein